MSILEELSQIVNQLTKYENYDSPELDELEKAANLIGKSWSGSWLGYHSRVYYFNLQTPPPGSDFSQEWGLSHGMDLDGSWVEYSYDVVVNAIYQQAGLPIDWRIANGSEAAETFEDAQLSAISLLSTNYNLEHEEILKMISDKIQSSIILTERGFIEHHRPTKMISRDMIAVEKGFITPPHLAVIAKICATRSPFLSCKELKKYINQAIRHIKIMKKNKTKVKTGSSRIFIGHGHSLLWREFKDFIGETLGLHWDEFNRVPPAGVPNTKRLAQMLNQACMAFLVMTAEDEDAKGKLHARENVIHEAGLFQGRLGFERAIILLEEGCQEFSNIEGLGQIRFPKGNISAVFESVRRVLEREKIIQHK